MDGVVGVELLANEAIWRNGERRKSFKKMKGCEYEQGRKLANRPHSAALPSLRSACFSVEYMPKSFDLFPIKLRR